MSSLSHDFMHFKYVNQLDFFLQKFEIYIVIIISFSEKALIGKSTNFFRFVFFSVLKFEFDIINFTNNGISVYKALTCFCWTNDFATMMSSIYYNCFIFRFVLHVYFYFIMKNRDSSFQSK